MANNELYHWKYVSKKKVNDKWRYTYPDGSTSSKIGDRIKDALGVDEKTRYEEASAKKAEADKAASTSKDALDRRKTLYERHPSESSKDNYDAAIARQKAEWENSVEAGKKAMEAKQELYNTPIGKIYKANNAAKAHIEQTIKNVDKKFDELSNKVDKEIHKQSMKGIWDSIRKEARESEAEQRKTEAQEESAAKKRKEDDAKRKQQIERDFKESLRTAALNSESDQREEERKEEVRRKYINPYLRKRRSQNSFNRK